MRHMFAQERFANIRWGNSGLRSYLFTPTTVQKALARASLRFSRVMKFDPPVGGVAVARGAPSPTRRGCA